MKEITLSLAHLKAIRAEHGAEAAVEAIRAEIQGQVKLRVELESHGPNDNGDQVASIAVVRASSRTKTDFFSPEVMTNGYGETGELAIANLFTVLTNPQNLLDLEEGEVAGLLVGSSADPAAFVTFGR